MTRFTHGTTPRRDDSMKMDADAQYKGYSIRHIGSGELPNVHGYMYKVKTYMVYDPQGRKMAKAWGMSEAKALVNADIRGEL